VCCGIDFFFQALPGLFISYVLRFDYTRGRVGFGSYFMVAMVGYALGLMCTYMALAVMQSGQPALLYLVPCILGPVAGLACYRGDLGALWRGPDGGVSGATDVSLTTVTSQVAAGGVVPADNRATGAYAPVSLYDDESTPTLRQNM
jgi:hypothetical protein